MYFCLQFSVIIPESNPLKIAIICLLLSTYILLRMTGIIGQKNQELEWKNSNTGLGARRQSTNDISSNIREKHRRPSEEALFSSGKNMFTVVKDDTKQTFYVVIVLHV